MQDSETTPTASNSLSFKHPASDTHNWLTFILNVKQSTRPTCGKQRSPPHPASPSPRRLGTRWWPAGSKVQGLRFIGFGVTALGRAPGTARTFTYSLTQGKPLSYTLTTTITYSATEGKTLSYSHNETPSHTLATEPIIMVSQHNFYSDKAAWFEADEDALLACRGSAGKELQERKRCK